MKRSILLLLGLVAMLSLTACSDDVTSPADATLDGSAAIADADKARAMGMDNSNRAPKPGMMTIAEIAEAEGFTLLLAAVDYIAETNPESPLVAGLLDYDQYTVFAPTDPAFVALVTALDDAYEDFDADDPFASIDDLLGMGTVEAVVSYHVTEGRRAANSVLPRNGMRVIQTLLEDASFMVDTEGMITAVGNTAMIETPNVSARNGIIHVIDTVILPVELEL